MNKFPRVKAPATSTVPACEYTSMDGLCVPPPPILGDQPCRNPYTGQPEVCYQSPWAENPCAAVSPYTQTYICVFRPPEPPAPPPTPCYEMLGFWFAVLAALVCP
jgi:hypothetical protein